MEKRPNKKSYFRDCFRLIKYTITSLAIKLKSLKDSTENSYGLRILIAFYIHR